MGRGMVTVAVVVPFVGGCKHREAAWEWAQDRYRQAHPDWPVIVGTSEAEGFSRSQAILDAAGRTDADVLVIADADVWVDNLTETVDQAVEHGWAVPHLLIHRLSQESTGRVLMLGADWHGLPLSADNPQDRRPYRGNETGTLVVVTREAFNTAPPDPRFTGWGSEDVAWGYALRSLVGPPWRGSDDLVHLWHPPQPRLNRIVGNRWSQQLAARYQRARRNPAVMRRLVEEGQRESPSPDDRGVHDHQQVH